MNIFEKKINKGLGMTPESLLIITRFKNLLNLKKEREKYNDKRKYNKY